MTLVTMNILKQFWKGSHKTSLIMSISSRGSLIYFCKLFNIQIT